MNPSILCGIVFAVSTVTNTTSHWSRGSSKASISPSSAVESLAMNPLTVYLGRLLGLFTLITSFWLLVERQNAISTIPALLGNRPVMVIFAIIALAGGLAIVLGHNIWSGGPLPVLVTLIGWIMLIRGVLFLFLPPEATLHIFAAMQFERFFYIYLAIPFILGIYLTYLSFSRPSGI
jgi:hypothetical protein